MLENIKIIRRYWKLLRPKWKIALVLFGSKILASVASLFLPITVAGIVRYVTEKDARQTLLFIGLFTFAFLTRWFFYYWNYISGIWSSNDNYDRLEDRLIRAISKYDLDYPLTISSSEILHTVSEDVVGLGEFNDNVSDFFVAFVKTIVIFVIVVSVSFLAGIWMALIFTVYIFLLEWFIQKDVHYLLRQKRDQDKVGEMLTETLSGKKEIQVYNMKDRIFRQFGVVKDQFRKDYLRKRRYHDARYSILPFLLRVGKIGTYLLLLYFFFQGNYGIDVVVMVIGYYDLLHDDIEYMETVSNEIKEKNVSIERVNKVLNYHSRDMVSFGDNVLDTIKGVVNFHHVFAFYRKKPVLFDVSFTAQPHQITTLVGHSGSGKTTIFNVLLRLYDYKEGKVTIDGIDIGAFDDDVYSSNVSVVNQKPFVFSLSIRDNLGLVDRSFKNQQAVCEFLGIHEEILSLPQGYDTVLLENGSNITTELKQMLSFARALLSRAEILLFDEITSSLDQTATKKIVALLKKLKKTHTIIMITHKPELMSLSDQLVVLKKGRIVIKGNISKVEKNRYYQQLKRFHQEESSSVG